MDKTPLPMATPHPIWLGGILMLGGGLAAVDGQWGLAALFFGFSGAVLVGGIVGWRKRRRGVDAVVASVPPQR